MAAKEAFAQAIHLRALLEDMETPQRDATIIHIDSRATYQASVGDDFPKRLKHVSGALQWVREIIRSNEASLHLVKTHEQGAEYLTKALPHEASANCCQLVGIKKPTTWNTRTKRNTSQRGDPMSLDTRGNARKHNVFLIIFVS